MAENKKPKDSDRRKFIVRTLQGVGIAILGGAVWGGYVNEAKSSQLALRPPGALPEDDFIRKCIRCGMCVEACKNRENNPDETKQTATLRLSAPGDHRPKQEDMYVYPKNIPLGTPYFVPREIPCYMCEDIPCAVACPTGALDTKLLTTYKDGKGNLDISKAKMGVAVVDDENCIAYWGLQCDACYRACPLLGEAIKLEMRRNRRTERHAYLLPTVYADACTGCGLCEHACVTEKPAIHVLPKEIALGRVGKHYVKGWEKSDEERLKGSEGIQKTKTPRSEKKPEDYLNTGDLLDEE